MTTIVLPHDHDLAVLAALRTIADPAGTLVPVGYAEAPEGALLGVQERTGPDYLILYPLNSTQDGPLGDPYADTELIYQITCVGRLAGGVRWLVGQIEPALRTAQLLGRAITRVSPDDLGAVRPDPDLEPPVFLATPRFRIASSPT